MTNNVSFRLIIVASWTTALTTGGSEVNVAIKLTTAAENRPPTVDTSDHERAPPSHLATQAMPYPTIIPAAISSILCDTAAAELKDSVAVKEQDPAAELELTSTCANIAREAHKTYGACVSSLGGGSFQPCSLSIVNFREPTQAHPRPPETPKNVAAKKDPDKLRNSSLATASYAAAKREPDGRQ
ncbi:hypothetical protein Q7P37_000004 [Cladosporium fusiforme]